MRYFDLHCDTAAECSLQNCSLYDNHLHISLKKASAFSPYIQVFAVWIPDDYRDAAAEKRYDGIYDTFVREMKQNAQTIRFCQNSGELETAVQSGKNAAILSIEGSAALCGKIENLYKAYERGVRIITLTWNGPCEAGDGSGVKNAGGLTPFGFSLVSEMSRLHMAIDVSHLSDKAFYDVASRTSGPFVATHSNSRSVCPHERNLTDEMFGEIVKRKGLVGLNLYPPFIKSANWLNEKVKVESIINHIDHFLSLHGENVLAIGADFDGARMPAGISGIQDMPKLYELLLKYYTPGLADSMFFNNAYKFFCGALTDCQSCNNIYEL